MFFTWYYIQIVKNDIMMEPYEKTKNSLMRSFFLM